MTISERDAHQRVLVTLIGRLQFWLMDGELRTLPTVLDLEDEQVKPDIFWVSDTNQRCQVTEDGTWQGAPDLVIEVVSPETEAADRGKKFALYQASQVFEYWIVNPVSRFVEVYVLLNRRFQRTGLYEVGENFSSGVLNGRVFEVNDVLGIRSKNQ